MHVFAPFVIVVMVTRLARRCHVLEVTNVQRPVLMHVARPLLAAVTADLDQLGLLAVYNGGSVVLLWAERCAGVLAILT